MRCAVLWLLGLALVEAGAQDGEKDRQLRLNQIQVIGTHNSYHVAPAKSIKAFIGLTGKSNVEALEYSQPPLPEQLDKLGMRQFELDLYADPKGGLFAEPALYKQVLKAGGDPGANPNENNRLMKPGFKVLHIPDVDFGSNVPTFIDGLTQLRDWSLKNPTHVPMMVMLEIKEEVYPLMPTKVIKFDAAMMDQIDKDIRLVFKEEHLITPDLVRGKHESLKEAIKQDGWPTLARARGKILFCLNDPERPTKLYMEKHPDLKGRVLFCPVSESHDAAAFFKLNDPVADFEKIRRLVKAGYIVRTRADEGTVQARKNETTRRDKAFESGAQYISTDFPVPNKEWSEYCVTFPGRTTARVNVVNAPRDLWKYELEQNKR